MNSINRKVLNLWYDIREYMLEISDSSDTFSLDDKRLFIEENLILALEKNDKVIEKIKDKLDSLINSIKTLYINKKLSEKKYEEVIEWILELKDEMSEEKTRGITH